MHSNVAMQLGAALRRAQLRHTDGMTLLDEIIDGSTSGSVSTSNLLRKVQVAATRLGAPEVLAWVKGELNGYQTHEELPQFRSNLDTRVQGTFLGYGNSRVSTTISAFGTQPDFAEAWFSVSLFQPLSELEALASAAGTEDPTRPWAVHAVAQYNKWGSEGKVMRMEMMDLFSAHNVITRQTLAGIIDISRNHALAFALELQQANPEAGTLGGPTVAEDPELRSVIYHVTNNITGHGANIATGSDIRQRSMVAAGDVESFKSAATEFGLDTTTASEFVDAVVGDASVDGPRVHSILERVRNGSISLSGNVAANLAASGLLEIATQFLGK